jgi:hypothetical protein
MEIPLSLVLPLIAILALTLLVTGPGMWSEEWGWWWVKRRPGRGQGAKDEKKNERGDGE